MALWRSRRSANVRGKGKCNRVGNRRLESREANAWLTSDARQLQPGAQRGPGETLVLLSNPYDTRPFHPPRVRRGGKAYLDITSLVFEAFDAVVFQAGVFCHGCCCKGIELFLRLSGYPRTTRRRSFSADGGVGERQRTDVTGRRGGKEELLCVPPPAAVGYGLF